MRLAALTAVVVVAGAAAALYQSLPEPARALTTSSAAGVRGVIHVHTRRSDGSGTPEEVAAAGAAVGLTFIVLTDHGNGTRAPASPRYHRGVLVIDAIEISGDDGHVLALGLPKTPYPLAGEVRDIVDDIGRHGGMSIAAHPDSPKPELRWTEWTGRFDGIEWLNGDSALRDEPWSMIARAVLTYPFRSTSSLAAMLDRPDDVLRRWDVLTARRRVVGLSGTDAHATLDVRHGQPRRPLSLPVPGYEAMFRTVSITAPGLRFTGQAEADAAALIEAVRQGRVYSAVDALATPAVVSFRAVRGNTTWTPGDLVPPGGRNIELQVDSNGPPEGRVALIRNGAILTTVSGPSLRRTVPAEPAVYRVEIQLPGSPGNPPVPWVLTNPLYIRTQEAREPIRGRAADQVSQYVNGPPNGWRVGTTARSKGAIDVVRNLSGTELLLRWAIGGTIAESPYAEFAMPAGRALSKYDRLMFTARADRPMRLSVQFRTDTSDRWRRSVYLDDQERQAVVFFDDVRPVGVTSRRRLDLSAVRDLLFVVDTVNTRPGTAGQFWIDDVKYAR